MQVEGKADPGFLDLIVLLHAKVIKRLLFLLGYVPKALLVAALELGGGEVLETVRVQHVAMVDLASSLHLLLLLLHLFRHGDDKKIR